MDTQENFYPGVVSIGDILKANGYKQELVIGSDAVFGGRKLFSMMDLFPTTLAALGADIKDDHWDLELICTLIKRQ